MKSVADRTGNYSLGELAGGSLSQSKQFACKLGPSLTGITPSEYLKMPINLSPYQEFKCSDMYILL